MIRAANRVVAPFLHVRVDFDPVEVCNYELELCSFRLLANTHFSYRFRHLLLLYVLVSVRNS